MQQIHVACGQIVCQPADIDHNLAEMARCAAWAGDAGARVLLFGEAALQGYGLDAENLAKCARADGPEVERLLELSAAHDLVIVCGAFEASDEGRHVSQFITFPDGHVRVNRKHRLTPDEQQANMIPGAEERLIFARDGVRFACGICADSGIPDLKNKLAARGCQCYLASVAGGAGRHLRRRAEDLEDPVKLQLYLEEMEKVCFMGKAIEECVRHHMALVAVNLVLDDGWQKYHPGHSSIIDSQGRLVDFWPGQYVFEWNRTRLLHGDIVVQQPRCVVSA